MKIAGVILILAGILGLMGYGFFQLMVTATIPLWVRAGLGVLAAGLVLVLISLSWERTRDRRKEVESNDPGQYS